MQPDIYTFSSAMSACEAGNEWERGLLLLAQAMEEVKVNAFAFSTAVSACAKTSSWRMSIEVLREAQELQALQ